MKQNFPAIFCPCEYKNHIFMDGGVLNNLPTEELKKVYTGKILSVNFESYPILLFLMKLVIPFIIGLLLIFIISLK